MEEESENCDVDTDLLDVDVCLDRTWGVLDLDLALLFPDLGDLDTDFDLDLGDLDSDLSNLDLDLDLDLERGDLCLLCLDNGGDLDLDLDLE